MTWYNEKIKKKTKKKKQIKNEVWCVKEEKYDPKKVCLMKY